jgi:hypothetical protein
VALLVLHASGHASRHYRRSEKRTLLGRRDVEYAGAEERTSSSSRGGVAVKAGKRGLRTSLPSTFRLHISEAIDWTLLQSRVTPRNGTGFPRSSHEEE